MSKSVREIVAEYLKANGFDGLFSDGGDCACELSDLMPCGRDWDCTSDCEAGYRVPCPPACGDHDWHMAEKKEAEK